MERLTLDLGNTDEVRPCNYENCVRAPTQGGPIEICTRAATWAVDVGNTLVRGTIVNFNAEVIRPGNECASPLNCMDSTFCFVDEVLLVAQPALGIQYELPRQASADKLLGGFSCIIGLLQPQISAAAWR